LQRAIGESTDGTDIKIRSSIEDVAVTDDQYRLIYNTLKEGLSNGLRHGKATAFWFELKTQDEEIRFLLSDNGQGIQTESLEEGFGLGSMKKEAERLGGTVAFVFEKDEGFEIHLRLPMYEMKGGKE
jgi:signal transduction histidine kinase